MRYTETTLSNWTAPLSQTEEQRVENTVNMIKDALRASSDMKYLDYEVFAQGSYANNTNVRQNSDVDICVMLKSTFYTEYPDGLSRSDYGFSEGSISFRTYKVYVLQALEEKFGSWNVTVGKKSIKISSNTYHVNADVVPAFMLKDFQRLNSKDADRYIEGIRFYSSDDREVTNFPKDHVRNGINKNKRTNYKYKKLVRIVKHIRNDMVDANLIDGDRISSFFIECLVWNASDDVITRYQSWQATVLYFLSVMREQLNSDTYKEWGEVSERFYLFHAGRKWSIDDAKLFIDKALEYMDYE